MHLKTGQDSDGLCGREGTGKHEIQKAGIPLKELETGLIEAEE